MDKQDQSEAEPSLSEQRGDGKDRQLVTRERQRLYKGKDVKESDVLSSYLS